MPQLTAAAMYAVLAARQQVFAVEQQCAFLDAAGYDVDAWHLLGWVDGGRAQDLAAYLRVLDPGRKFAEPSIGRVLTVPPYRRIGLGRVLMAEGVSRTFGVWPGQPIRIAAQQRLEAFYASLGFRTVSDAYEEDGIPHVDMVVEAPSRQSRAKRGIL
jgi:ElaA protein